MFIDIIGKAAVSVTLLTVSLSAQCLVDNPGGKKANPFRPSNADTPAANFSPLEYVNDDLPDWICFTAGYRARFEGYENGSFKADNTDSYLLTRFRLGTLIKPTSWLNAYVELQDATAIDKNPPLAPPYQSTWDLRRAYVDIGNLETSPVSIRIGRQDLNFGAGRLVGTSYWRNASRGYDAAMLVLNTNWIRVNAFSASVVIPGDNGLSHHQQGNNLHGLVGIVKKFVPGSTLEPYLFWKLAPGVTDEERKLVKTDVRTIGARWSGNASQLDYDAEVAGQTGSLGQDQIRAWAWVADLGYTLKDAPLTPHLFAEYDFASGDKNPTDGRRGTFDQLYPNIHDHHGLADQVAWQNLKEFRAGARISLRRNWTVAGAYNDWWLASATDAFYNSSGSIVARDPKGLSGTHIGEEYDAETTYRFNRDLEFGTGIGHILPGGFLAKTIKGKPYTYPYVMLNYNFF